MLTMITTKNYSHRNNTTTTTKNNVNSNNNDRSTTTTTTTAAVTTRYINTAKQDLSRPLKARSKRCCLT